MPVSNRMSLSPCSRSGEFLLEHDVPATGNCRQHLLHLFLRTPVKVPVGSPSGSGPSETMVTSAPDMKRCQ